MLELSASGKGSGTGRDAKEGQHAFSSGTTAVLRWLPAFYFLLFPWPSSNQERVLGIKLKKKPLKK